MELRPVQVGSLAALVLVLGTMRVVVGPRPAPTANDAGGRAAAVASVNLTSGSAPTTAAGPLAPSAPAPVVPAASVPRRGAHAVEPAPEHFDGAPATGATAPCAPRPAATPSGGTWAVIVGIDDYPGAGHDLVASVNDAREVDTALAGLGVPADHRLLVLDGNASACGVRSAIDWLVGAATPDATAVFFFAGHARKPAGGGRAIVTADASLMTDEALGASLARLKASRAWIAMATCYGGGFTQVLAPGRILTGAAGADSLAYEDADLGRSFLVEFMVDQAIIGRAAPTSVEAAFAYAQAAIQRALPNRVPVQVDEAPGDLDLRPHPGAPLSAVTPVAGPPSGGSGAAGGAPPDPPALPVIPATQPCRPILLGLLCSS